MNNQTKSFYLSISIISLLFLASTVFSWIFLSELETYPSSTVLMFQAVMLISVFTVVVLLVFLFKNPATEQDAVKLIQKYLQQATDDTEQTRKTIIRLRQIQDPNKYNLAVSIATLLERLLADLKNIKTIQSSTELENLSVTITASELQAKNELLIKAPNSKSEFLSRMGDEITLPMKSLGNMLRLLKNMELDNETRDLLLIATHSAHSLIENLSNILAFSKLDANLLRLNNEPFELANTISSVIETQESIALSKGLLIETHIKPDVNDIIKADKKLLIKILDNLLSNAIRFTNHGYIKVVVDNVKENNRQLIRFTIIDTGIGIPDTALSTLFDSLETDTDLVNSSFTGRLRLIVCKQLCELMGGNIGVRSEEGKGSQFWYTVEVTT